MDGQELRTAEEVWVKLAESEARMHLMVELGHIQVGFPDVEQFCLDLEGKYRSTVTGGLREKGKGSPEWQIVRLCMNLKMIDERKTHSKLEGKKYSVKKKIEEEYGKNNRKGRNIVKNLRKEASRAKVTAMRKNEDKMKHLRKSTEMMKKTKLTKYLTL